MPKSSDSMHPSIFTVENVRWLDFTWNELNLQEIVNFILIMGPREPKLNWYKIHLWVWSNLGEIMISYVSYKIVRETDDPI